MGKDGHARLRASARGMQQASQLTEPSRAACGAASARSPPRQAAHGTLAGQAQRPRSPRLGGGAQRLSVAVGTSLGGGRAGSGHAPSGAAASLRHGEKTVLKMVQNGETGTQKNPEEVVNGTGMG